MQEKYLAIKSFKKKYANKIRKQTSLSEGLEADKGKHIERADNKCEFCGVENYAMRLNPKTGKEAKIILTIAHLDHTPENCAHCEVGINGNKRCKYTTGVCVAFVATSPLKPRRNDPRAERKDNDDVVGTRPDH